MIYDAANPEGPGTQLCTPKLHTRAAPLSVHVKAATPLSLSLSQRKSTDPNMFCRSNDQNEFVRDLKSDLLAHRSCPDFDYVKISQSQIRTKKKKKKRTNSASSSRKQSDAKAIRLFKADSKSRYLKQKDKEDEEGE
jgi:hypothetical protein